MLRGKKQMEDRMTDRPYRTAKKRANPVGTTCRVPRIMGAKARRDRKLIDCPLCAGAVGVDSFSSLTNDNYYGTVVGCCDEGHFVDVTRAAAALDWCCDRCGS